MAARVPGMAARNTPQRKPRATRRAVALERLERIGGTRGMETAVHAKKRADGVAITPNEKR
jgi:hypothetical protein